MPRSSSWLWALALVLLAACGGSETAPEDDQNSPPPALQIADGVFDVTTAIVFDGCESDSNYAGAFDLHIDGSRFTLGTRWSGTWDARRGACYGESEHFKYTVRFCTVNRWTSLTMTFQSEDEFTGSITFHQRVDGDCQTPCVTTWSIAGKRRIPPTG